MARGRRTWSTSTPDTEKSPKHQAHQAEPFRSMSASRFRPRFSSSGSGSVSGPLATPKSNATSVSKKGEPQPTVTVTETAAADTSQSEAAKTASDDKPTADAPKKATVSDFVGMGLQSAQDKAQGAGFHGLTSHDALGRKPMQAFDRNWKVCSQTMEAGAFKPTDTDLHFGALKLREDCPAKDEKPPTAEGDKVPNFAGESVKAARSALDSGVSLTVRDALPDDRWVLVESSWKVCTQSRPRAHRSTGSRSLSRRSSSRGPVPDRQWSCGRAHDAT